MKSTLFFGFLMGGVLLASLMTPGTVWGAEETKAAQPKIYDESADGAKLIDAALSLAKKENKHVLLQFGGNWCVWCLKLHALFESDKAIGQILKDNYVVVLIDLDNKPGGHNKELTTKYQAEHGFGLPFIVILDANGKHLLTKNTQELEAGDRHSPEKVSAFLQAWTPSYLQAKPISQWVREHLKGDKEDDLAFRVIQERAADAVPYLIEATKGAPNAGDRNEKDFSSRVKAYRALGNLRASAKSAVPALVEQLNTKNDLLDFVRVALAGIGPDAKDAIPALGEALHSSDLDLQYVAAFVLTHVDPNHADLMPTMQEWLNSPDVIRRRTAPIVLVELGPAGKAAIPALTQALNDDDETVREHAIAALKKINPRPAVEAK